MLRHISAVKNNQIAKENPGWILTEKKYKIADIDDNEKIDTTDLIKMLRHISASKNQVIKKEHPNWIIN